MNVSGFISWVRYYQASKGLTQLLLGLSLLWCLGGNVSAQDRLLIEQTDSLRNLIIDGQRVNRLIGNVVIRDRDRVFRSDSAYHYANLNTVKAWGGIQITSTSDRIWADSIRYDANIDTGFLIGRVVIAQDSVTLFSTKAKHDFANKISEFPNELQLVDPKSLLKANKGFYFHEADSAVFVGNIQLADSSSYLEGDSLIYKRLTKSFWMKGNIYAEDLRDSIRVRGNQVVGDSTGYKKISGLALIEKFTSSSDTTFIQASEIEYLRKGEHYHVYANKAAEVWNKDFSALADTIRFENDIQRIRLLHLSKIWHKYLQLSAPLQEIYVTDVTLDSLYSYKKPFFSMQDSISGRIHQLRGERMSVYFDSSRVRQMIVPTKTELLYFPTTSENQADGAILIRLESLNIQFIDNEIDTIEGVRAVDGEVYEEASKPESMRLDGFMWDPELRPSRPAQKPKPRWNKPDRSTYPIRLPPGYLQSLK